MVSSDETSEMKPVLPRYDYHMNPSMLRCSSTHLTNGHLHSNKNITNTCTGNSKFTDESSDIVILRHVNLWEYRNFRPNCQRLKQRSPHRAYARPEDRTCPGAKDLFFYSTSTIHPRESPLQTITCMSTCTPREPSLATPAKSTKSTGFI